MRRLAWMLEALLLAACTSDTSGPAGKPETELHFVRQSQLAPPLLTTTASFYAKLGEDRAVNLFYEDPLAPGDTGAEYLQFQVAGNSLYQKPDGTPFAPGDSILITITVVDPDLFVFEFQPTGLRFHPQFPAQLEIEYFNADHDFNGDGTIDSTDDEIERELDIWQRRPPDTVWFPLGAVEFEPQDELEADIRHFTDHAIAW